MCGGTNWPKRGNKHTNWQGGMNGAAFVSGGFIPAALRGTHSDVAMHIVDWYATFCTASSTLILDHFNALFSTSRPDTPRSTQSVLIGS